MVSTLREIWALFRLHAMPTYAIVILAATLFGKASIGVALTRSALVFTPFILLYGGLYTINGIADRHDDALHVHKRHRPVASGRVSIAHAWAIAIAAIGAAMTCAVALSPVIAWIFCGFIALNLCYTYMAKRIAYLELLFNGSTYLLRAILGAVLGGGMLPMSVGWALFWAIVGVSAARRRGEMCDGHGIARPTLRHYTKASLFAVYGVCTGCVAWSLAISVTPIEHIIIAALLLLQLSLCYGSERWSLLRRMAQW